LILTTGYASLAVEQVYHRARALCQHLGEAPDQFAALWRFWTFAFTRADMRTAHRVATQLLAVAQCTADPESLTVADYALRTALYYMGAWEAAGAHLERGLATYAVEHDRAVTPYYSEDRGVVLQCQLALLCWAQSKPGQAQHHLHAALQLAQALARPLSLVRVWSAAARLHHWRREWAQMLAAAETVVGLGAAHGFPYWVVVGTLSQGGALVAIGQAEEGLGQLQHALTRFRAWGAEIALPYWLALLAEAHSACGQVADGLRVLAEAFAVAEKTGQQSYAAELYRLKGDLLLHMEQGSERAEAASCLQQAIALARQQQAKSFELRAVLSLSRLWQQHGNRDAARQQLTAVYGEFTAGVDTADLQDARVLLDVLA
jgi:adenylate cyclase